MNFYLQFGHGMMSLTRDLLKNWGGTGVILSPRDLEKDQMLRLSSDILRLKGEPLLDPQCYIHDADHHRLNTHEYYKMYRSSATANFVSGRGAIDLIESLFSLSRELGVTRHILPGLFSSAINDAWLRFHQVIVSAGERNKDKDKIISTIALSSDILKDEDQIESIIESTRDWPVDGYYIVAQSPSGYLCDDPIWLANLAILAAGLRLQNRSVIVGYCNHQQLILSLADIEAICSGTWMNVRSFPPGKFSMSDGEDIQRRSTWYYCPQAMSEFTLPFLDIARSQGVLASMAPPPGFDSQYADALFAGPDPSAVGWGERQAFSHYLSCLNTQVYNLKKDNYKDSLERYNEDLDSAEQTLRTLHRHNVRGRGRDFLSFIDVNLAAVGLFNTARGSQMQRYW